MGTGATVTVASMGNYRAPTMSAEMVIIGGGISGLLAAQRAKERNIPYVIIDRADDLGGIWDTMANNYSYLQAFEPMYRFDPKYRLNTNPLTKNSGAAVLHKLRQFASDLGIYAHAHLGTEVVTIREQKGASHKYRVICKDLHTGIEKHMLCNFLCVCCGILSTQWTAEERGVKDIEKFKGKITMAGKHEGQDSLVGNTDLTGKRVVIMGSGSFAAEALEAAGRCNAQHITVVSRPRYRWILPFSRQFTVTAMSYVPLVPWKWKMGFTRWYLDRFFYRPCHMPNFLAHGKPHEMDYSGQCNDGYFRLAYQKRLTTVVDKVERLEADSVVLKDGGKLPCDMLVVAAGCKYNTQPSFLKELGLDFEQMHNFAFLGQNPRIGCASDFVFAFVPLGPQKQLEMYFHAVDACRRGMEKEARAALQPTPLPNHGQGMHKGGRMAGSFTWFEYRKPWSTLNIAMEERQASYLRTMSVGLGLLGRLGLRMKMTLAGLAFWGYAICQALKELTSFQVYGPGVEDHYLSPVERANFEEGRDTLPKNGRKLTAAA